MIDELEKEKQREEQEENDRQERLKNINIRVYYNNEDKVIEIKSEDLM